MISARLTLRTVSVPVGLAMTYKHYENVVHRPLVYLTAASLTQDNTAKRPSLTHTSGAIGTPNRFRASLAAADGCVHVAWTQLSWFAPVSHNKVQHMLQPRPVAVISQRLRRGTYCDWCI